MRFTTALALLLGLGTRIVYNKFIRIRNAPGPGIEDHALSGLWQGVLLYYFLMEYPSLAFGVGFGIAARLVVGFLVTYNATATACTMLGVAIGVLFTDILSQVLEDGPEDALLTQGRYDSSVVSAEPYFPRRLVQFRRTSSEEREHRHQRRRRREFLESTPSVTTGTTQSWDSLSDWVDPGHTMSPLEREVAALRKKASMADSERRRFKEEKQWAQSQGNKARATQMGWQVKRYSALMQSFHREADMRLLEATNDRHRKELSSALSQVGVPASKPRLPMSFRDLDPTSSRPLAVTVTSPSSPPPRPVPPPTARTRRASFGPSGTQETQPRVRKSSTSKGKERAIPADREREKERERDRALPAGSSFTGMHHKKTTSVVSRPSVRIEVHELPSRSRSKKQ
ncbi:hypothetical protein FA95DRAFT_147074 [Auriscalpium vulgare]|uniref:Uncharacterized protein n=1 Tax=Auriscalpium vulgare TaxID=40419 RepID=A0ACB8S6W7_9AGAM|nr:hypothetical protein FA95DRAFT_147074 [Auriscalpium vulgare]